MSESEGSFSWRRFYYTFVEYLEAKPCRAYDYFTGTEDLLKKWIFEQGTNYIDPIKIFRKSLELNGGNLWNASLAIHRLLRNQARWFDKNRYNTSSSDFEEKQFWMIPPVKGLPEVVGFFGTIFSPI